MNRKLKYYLKKVGESIVFWALAFLFFAIFRYFGIESEEAVIIKPGYEESSMPSSILPIFTLTGILVGFMFANVDVLFESFLSKKRIPLGLQIVLKILIDFIFFVAIASTIITLANSMYNIKINNEVGWWRTDKTFWTILFYVLICSLVHSFIKIANEKFGKGVFLKILMGKYKDPKEEKRIFMFLDLKSSTTIAEKLGHFKYSQLIQDCFYDLNSIVDKHQAEIYQYVGDEAVLSWPYKKGLFNNQCIALFFDFKDALYSKKEYYESNYGQLPIFKAGLHGGKLMVAEVGVVKKELAFHGDVINTSARIQAECNAYNESLLISESIAKNLNFENEYTSSSIGSILLKGKLSEVNIFSVKKNN